MNQISLHVGILSRSVDVVHRSKNVGDVVESPKNNRSNPKVPVKVIQMCLVNKLCPCHKSVVTIVNIKHLVGEEAQLRISIKELLKLEVLPPPVCISTSSILIRYNSLSSLDICS